MMASGRACFFYSMLYMELVYVHQNKEYFQIMFSMFIDLWRLLKAVRDMAGQQKVGFLLCFVK